MKKIAILTDNAFTYTGREAICNFMASCFSDENDVDIYSLNGSGKPHYPFENTNRIYTFQDARFKIISAMSVINKGSYDYVFVVSMGKLSVLTGMTKFLNLWNNKTQYVACEHVSFESLKSVVKLLKLFFLRFYNRVVVLTDVDKIHYNSIGIKCVRIENPVSFKGYTRNKRTHKFIAVGRLSKQKNFSEMLRIWAEFKKEDKLSVLYILGDGDELDLLKDLIVNLNVHESVILKGKVDNIEKYYKDADCCLMTSLYEGLPMALLEAKSWSLPTIAYDCPTGPRQIINNNVDGFLIDKNARDDFIQSLKKIAKEDDVFFAFSKNTKLTSTRFEPEVIKKYWLDLIKE